MVVMFGMVLLLPIHLPSDVFLYNHEEVEFFVEQVEDLELTRLPSMGVT